MEDEDDEDLDEVEEIGDEDEGEDEEDPLNQGNGDGEEEGGFAALVRLVAQVVRRVWPAFHRTSGLWFHALPSR